MTAFTSHFAFEFKTGLRNPSAMLMNYLFPLGFYAMMGLVMTQINPGFKDVLVPALVIFAIMASNLLGLPGPLVDSREAGIYRSFKINGVPALSILSIPALSTIFHALIVSAIIALTAPLFDGKMPQNWLAFALITLLTAATFGTIGMLIGVIATSSRSVVLYSQLIFLPSMLLGGLMLPIEILPEAFQPIAAIFPTTQAMQAYLGLAYGQETLLNPALCVAVLLASSILCFGLAIYLFSWDSRNQTRRGHPALALLALLPFVAAVILARLI
jgi:ABC-2 type transport system permease protein